MFAQVKTRSRKSARHFNGRVKRGARLSASLVLRSFSAITVVAVVASGLTFTLAKPAEAIPPFPIDDSGSGTTGQVNPNWSRLLTGSGNVGGTYTSDGWTRLTNSGLNQSTNLLNMSAFPSTTGIQVEFDYRMAGGATFGGRTGDGMSMYLVNGTSGISSGALGSGLAYAGNQNACGVQGGYLGVGLDVFGDFSSPSNFASGGPGSRPSAVSVRGSGTNPCTANQASNFPWVTGANVSGLWTGVANDTQDPAAVANSLYRRMRVEVIPSGGNVQVTVSITPPAVKTSAPGFFSQILTTNLTGVTGQTALPATLRLGFGAGVGGATNFQDIRNISVGAMTDASVTQTMSAATPGQPGFPARSYFPGDQVTFVGTARNNGPSTIGNAPTGVARYFQDLSALPLTNVTWTCAGVGGATCVSPSGSGSVVSSDWTGPSGSSVVMTVTGTATPARGTFTSTARIPTNFTNNTVGANGSTVQLNGGLIDTNTANNTANLTFSVVAPNITTVKTVSTTSFGVGQPVTYTVTARNTGTAPGTATLSDTIPATVRATSATCAGTVGGTCDATLSGNLVTGSMTLPINGVATYTVQGVGLAPGSAQNTAQINVTNADCNAVCGTGSATSPSSTVLPVGLQLVKSANVSGAVADAVEIGDPITYEFEVTNTGGVSVNDLAIDETSFTGSGAMPAITCPVTTLAPGASTNCVTVAPYVVTQDDVNAGSITNEAVASGSIANVVEPVVSVASEVTVTALNAPALDVVKTVTSGDVTAAGQTVNYSFEVTNTGNLPLTGVEVNEVAFSGSGDMSAVSCPAAVEPLDPLEQVICTASYVTTQQDIDAGVITNTANVTGTAPDASLVTSPESDHTVVPIVEESLSVTKTATPTAFDAPGDVIDFTVTATNSGNVTLSDVTLAELEFTGAGGDPELICPDGVTSLAPDETTTCTASHVVTQADIEAGGFSNTAGAVATTPAGNQIDADPATVEVTATQTPSLQLTSTPTPAVVDAVGQTVQVAFEVKNIGNVVALDPRIDVGAFTGEGAAPAISCPATSSLAPGATMSCALTAPYVVTQGDIDSGGFQLITTAFAGSAAGDIESEENAAVVTADANSSLSLTKSMTPVSPGAYVAGQVVSLTYTAENTGNTTLAGVKLTQRSFTGSGADAGLSCTLVDPFVLAPSETTTCTVDYTLTQADVNAGSVQRVVYAEGIDPVGDTVGSGDVTALLEITQNGALEVTGSVTPDTVAVAGGTVDYSFSVKNTGNVTQSGVSLGVVSFTGSGGAPSLTCGAGLASMLPGAIVTCTASHVVTQSEVNAGAFDFTVRATGTAPGSVTTNSANETATVSVTASPSIALDVTHTFSPTGVYGAGQRVRFDFEMTNTGNVTLANAVTTLSDFTGAGSQPTVTCPSGAASLAPAAKVTCTAEYVLTQADINTGTISVNSVATGDTPFGLPTEVSSAVKPVSVVIPRDAELSLALTAVPDRVDQEGDIVDFTLTVTNTGVVTVSGMTIARDAFTGNGTLPTITCPAGAASMLPGAVVVCTVEYSAVQADIDAGGFLLTARAAGTAGNMGAVASAASTATVTGDVTPAISLVASADPSDDASFVVGQEITFSYVVRNTGNVTISTADVVKQVFTGAGSHSAIVCPPEASSLAPGKTVLCTSTYTLEQADIDADEVLLTAKANGLPPSGVRVYSNDSTVRLPALPLPSLSLVKDGTKLVPEGYSAGTTIDYTFDVVNTGNLTLFGAGIVEQEFTGSDALSAITCPVAESTTMYPGEGMTCTASYTLTQADVDRGTLSNTAIARATTPRVVGPVESDPSTFELPVEQLPSMTLTQTVAPPTAVRAGNYSVFTFTLTNTGNVTLTDLELREAGVLPLLGAETCDFPVTSVAPGDSTSCSVTVTFTQAQIDAGSFVNNVLAAAKTPASADVFSAATTATVTMEPEVTLGLTLRTSTDVVSAAGETVNYTFDVENTGSVTQSGVALSVTSFTGSGGAPSLTCGTGLASMAPGAIVTCTASHVVSQSDMNAGSFVLAAKVSGTAPGGVVTNSATETVTTTVAGAPAIALASTYTLTPVGVTGAGQKVSFSFEMTNTGNVTLANTATTLSGFTAAGSQPAVTCPSGAASLAPAAKVTCTAEYVLTQADINTGTISLNSVASGDTPFGTPTEVSSAVKPITVTIPRDAELSFALTAVPDRVDQEGDIVDFTLTVTNTGVVTVSGVSIARDAFTGNGTLPTITCPAGAASMLPGASVVCTVEYEAVQADIDAGGFLLTAHATGTTGNMGAVASAGRTATITSDITPSLSLVASGDPSDDASFVVGQEITFSYVVRNTGNVTISTADVVKQVFTGAGSPSAITCPPEASSLAPGKTVRCTSTYTLEQADIDADEVLMTAKANGLPPSGARVFSNDSTVRLPAPPLPSLSLVKKGTRLAPEEFVAGAVIDYTFDVVNTGNLTLFGAGITEKKFTGSGALSAVTCPVAESTTMFPGEGMTCTASYTLSQEDVDRGTLLNTAIASATTPRVAGPVESDPSTFALPVDQLPSMVLTQTVAPPTGVRAGDSSVFTFTVKNTGNVTLTDVALRGAGVAAAFGVGSSVCAFPVTRIAPGDSTSCSVTVTFTQAQIDAGSFTNNVLAAAKSPMGDDVFAEAVSREVTMQPKLSLDLKLTASTDVVRAAGDTIEYVAKVTNTGTGTLRNIKVVVTSFTGSGSVTAPVCSVTTLQPGESTDCGMQYTVSAADIANKTPLALGVKATGSAITGVETAATTLQSVAVKVEPVPSPGPGGGGLADTGGPGYMLLTALALLLLAGGAVFGASGLLRRLRRDMTRSQ